MANLVKQLKTIISGLSESDLNLLYATATRFGGAASEPEKEDDDVAVETPKAKKNKKETAAVAEAPKKRGRPKKVVEEVKPTKKAATKVSAKTEKSAPAAAGEYEFTSAVKKSDRAAVIAKIEKIMHNDSIDAESLKAKYEKKGVEINYGRGRKNDPAKKKIILVAAVNAGQKI